MRRPDGAARGFMRASSNTVGLKHPQMTEVIEEMQRLNTPSARGAFAHRWITVSAGRLEQTWPALYELLRVVEDKEIYKDAAALSFGRGGDKSYTSFRDYFIDVMGQPFERWTEMERTYHYARDYAPALARATFADAQAARADAMRELDEEDRKPGPKMGRPPKEETGKVGNIVTDLSRPEGNTARKALRRLRAHREDLHSRVIAGELSAHAAMIEAGFRERTIAVALRPDAIAALAKRHLSPKQRRELINLLCADLEA